MSTIPNEVENIKMSWLYLAVNQHGHFIISRQSSEVESVRRWTVKKSLAAAELCKYGVDYEFDMDTYSVIELYTVAQDSAKFYMNAIMHLIKWNSAIGSINLNNSSSCPPENAYVDGHAGCNSYFTDKVAALIEYKWKHILPKIDAIESPSIIENPDNQLDYNQLSRDRIKLLKREAKRIKADKVKLQFIINDAEIEAYGIEAKRLKDSKATAFELATDKANEHHDSPVTDKNQEHAKTVAADIIDKRAQQSAEVNGGSSVEVPQVRITLESLPPQVKTMLESFDGECRTMKSGIIFEMMHVITEVGNAWGVPVHTS